jgi:hypothetical protein
MPLRRAPKKSSKRTRAKIASANIREMHHGPSYKKVKRRHGAAVAHRMAIAAGLSAAGGGKRRKKKR